MEEKKKGRVEKYVIPSKSLRRPKSLGNIHSSRQSSHRAHHGALEQSLGVRYNQFLHKLLEKLAPLELTEG